jgi:hypothetical protein
LGLGSTLTPVAVVVENSRAASPAATLALGMPPAVSSLPSEIQLFARYLESERRASPHTLKGYLTDLGQYAEYLASAGEALVPGSPNAIRGFLARV